MENAILRVINEQSTVLDLSGGSHGDSTTGILAEAAIQLMHVEKLRVCRSGLVARDIEPLGRALQHLSSLRWLNLGNNELGSDGFAELGRYTARMRNLHTLSVHHNDIGAIGLEEFMRTAEYLESLEHLDLAENPVGDEGAKVVAASAEKLRSLRKLGLFECGIGDAGVRHLMDALSRAAWRDTVEQIGFRRNPVSEYRSLCETYSAAAWRQFDPCAHGEEYDPIDRALSGLWDEMMSESSETVSDDSDCDLRDGPAVNEQVSRVSREHMLTVRSQWSEIRKAVFNMFGAEWEGRFSRRLERHRGYKSTMLRLIHGMMERRSFRVRAYPLKNDDAERRSMDETTKRQHAYVHELPFRRALADKDVLVEIFRHVVRERDQSASISTIDDPVLVCGDCGAIHYPESDAGEEIRWPSACSACRKKSMGAEEFPSQVQTCSQCDIDFKPGTAWMNERRRAGQCPKGHVLSRPK